MRLAVDAAGEPADDDETRGGEIAAEAARDLAAVGGAGTCADDRDRRSRDQLRVGVAAQEEPRRRVVDRAEQHRERRVGAGEEAIAENAQPRELGLAVEAAP